MTESWHWAGLWLSSFLSATILPGSSEAALVLFTAAHKNLWFWALLAATAGNSAGSVVTYGMGRLLPQRFVPDNKWIVKYKRYGVWVLLLSWLPVAGDGLVLAAGVLRLNFWWFVLLMAVGKFTRYAVLVGGALAIF